MTGLGNPARQQNLQRVFILGGCLMLAAMAVGSALDRRARTDPAVASLVPQPLAADALLAMAQGELAAGRFSSAEGLARRAVQASPVEPVATALLGAARYGLGDEAGADAAFRIAGNFGWRATLTQYYWMGEALKVGDFRVASLRLDALLRQAPGLLDEQELIGAMEQDPRGRSALIDRLLQNPDWLVPYSSKTFDLSPDELLLRAQVLGELARRGRPLGCREIGPITRSLIRAGMTTQAHALWGDHCPAQRSGLISDPNFNSPDVHQSSSPFQWTVIGDSDVSVNLAENVDASGRHLVVATSASFPRKILQQLVMAPGGDYQLNWRARTSDGNPSRRIVVTFGCNADAREWEPAILDTVSGRWGATVRASGSCAGSWLTFVLQPGNDSIELDQISLRSVR